MSNFHYKIIKLDNNLNVEFINSENQIGHVLISFKNKDLTVKCSFFHNLVVVERLDGYFEVQWVNEIINRQEALNALRELEDVQHESLLKVLVWNQRFENHILVFNRGDDVIVDVSSFYFNADESCVSKFITVKTNFNERL